MTARKKTKGAWGGWRPGSGRKPVFPDLVSVTFDVERPDLDTLRAIAAKEGVSVAAVLRRAVKAHLRRRRGS